MPLHPLWRPFEDSGNAVRQSKRVAHRQTNPGSLGSYRRRWAADYEALRLIIESAVPVGIRRITHVGSTAIRGVIAKPVIDIDLLIADVSDESMYVPQLEAVGFRLIFRDDLAGAPHRQLTFASPNANLHVWNPDALEPQRHDFFKQWLSSHEDDRDRYSQAKKMAAADPTRRYNDGKAAAVYDIYERAFAADPDHEHTPQPRL